MNDKIIPLKVYAKSHLAETNTPFDKAQFKQRENDFSRNPSLKSFYNGLISHAPKKVFSYNFSICIY